MKNITSWIVEVVAKATCCSVLCASIPQVTSAQPKGLGGSDTSASAAPMSTTTPTTMGRGNFKGGAKGGWGQGQGRGWQKGGGQGFLVALQDLHLTPEQRQQIMASRSERQGMRLKVMKLREEKQKLQEVIASKDASEDDIRTQANNLKQVTSDLIDAKVESALSLKKILTPEQFTTLHEKMQKMRSERMQTLGGEQDDEESE